MDRARSATRPRGALRTGGKPTATRCCHLLVRLCRLSAVRSDQRDSGVPVDAVRLREAAAGGCGRSLRRSASICHSEEQSGSMFRLRQLCACAAAREPTAKRPPVSSAEPVVQEPRPPVRDGRAVHIAIRGRTWQSAPNSEPSRCWQRDGEVERERDGALHRPQTTDLADGLITTAVELRDCCWVIRQITESLLTLVSKTQWEKNRVHDASNEEGDSYLGSFWSYII